MWLSRFRALPRPLRMLVLASFINRAGMFVFPLLAVYLVRSRGLSTGEAGVLISGDALVSGHAISRVRGPQLLPGLFHHDRARATASLDVLGALEGDLLLPGHGPAHRGPLKDAAAEARERESRSPF